jgi:hypothetical protein
MMSFLLHGLTCAFWCTVLHFIHHRWHARVDAHYAGKCTRDTTSSPEGVVSGRERLWRI